MTVSVGQRLRDARVAQGFDLNTLVVRTRISERYLKAIESDDRSVFPSGFFYKSFVDQYARALSVDTQEIDGEIDLMLSADAPLPLPGQNGMATRRIPPIVTNRRSLRRRTYASIAATVVVIAGCSGFYEWWRHIQFDTRSNSTVQASSKRESARPAAVPIALSTSAPARTEIAAFPPATQPSAGNKVLLDFMAHEATWLSVSSDGHTVFRGLLEPNQIKTVEGRDFAKLTVGNAGGIEVRLNGRPIGPLGGRGQVRTVVFTQGSFQIVIPTKESD